MQSSNFKAHLALFLVNTLYGAGHIIAKGVMPSYLSPNVFILFRVTGACILFWLVYLFTQRERVARKDILLLAFCALFGVAINQLCFFHGLNLSSSINSGIIMAVNPIMVVILSFLVLKEKITLSKSLGIGIGAIGAILLTLTGNNGIDESIKGNLFLIINALSYAIYLVLAKPVMAQYKPLTVITYVFTFGLFFVLIFPPTLMDLSVTKLDHFPFDVVLKIIYVIIGVTFLTYLLTMYGLKYLSPSVSSAYIYLQPVLVMFFAYFLSFIGLAEDYTNAITVEKIIYMLLIFSGVYLTTKPNLSFRRNSKKGN